MTKKKQRTSLTSLEEIAKFLRENQGAKTINLFKNVGQYIDKVENQYFYGDTWKEEKKAPKKNMLSNKKSFNKSTPLSELFRENSHNDLRATIESWRPYLIGIEPEEDALCLSQFQFDKDRIYSNKVYRDLSELDAHGAIQVSLSMLAQYLTDHSNLSSSYASLYQQLKFYRHEQA